MTGLPMRVLTVLLAILATLALVGCGSNGPSQAELDAQDRKVIALAQKQQAHARIVMAVRAKNAATPGTKACGRDACEARAEAIPRDRSRGARDAVDLRFGVLPVRTDSGRRTLEQEGTQVEATPGAVLPELALRFAIGRVSRVRSRKYGRGHDRDATPAPVGSHADLRRSRRPRVQRRARRCVRAGRSARRALRRARHPRARARTRSTTPTSPRSSPCSTRPNELQAELRPIATYLYALVSTDSRNDVAAARHVELQTRAAPLAPLGKRLGAWLASLDVDALIARSPAAAEHEFALRKAAEGAELQMSEHEESLAGELAPSGSLAWQRLHGEISSQLDGRARCVDGATERVPMA